MSEKLSEKSEVSDVSYASELLRQHIAPSSGSVKTRIFQSARRLKWSPSRTKDVWYGDARLIKAHEMDRLKQLAGVSDARIEYREITAEIARLDAMLSAQDADFHSPFLDAFRAFFGGQDRTGNH